MSSRTGKGKPPITDPSERERERQKYRQNITKALNGDDPLEAYNSFVLWTLKNYGERDEANSGLKALLEEATEQFKDDPRYKASVKYLRLWARRARLMDRGGALGIFERLVKEDIGTYNSALWEDYAAILEASHKYAEADAAFQKGIEKGAKPLDRLKERYSEFQQRRAAAAPTGSNAASSSSSYIPTSTFNSTREQRLAVMLAPPALGKRPEKFRFNLSLLFTEESGEYSIQEARARSMGLLGKKWGPPPPSEILHAHRSSSMTSATSSVSSTSSRGSLMVPVDFNEDGARSSKLKTNRRSLLSVPEPTVTINTKEALADVFGMYNSPEKTYKLAMGSKHAPIKRIEPVTPVVAPGHKIHTLRSENEASGHNENLHSKTPTASIRPYRDENAQPAITPANSKITPFIDPDQRKTPFTTPRPPLGLKDPGTGGLAPPPSTSRLGAENTPRINPRPDPENPQPQPPPVFSVFTPAPQHSGGAPGKHRDVFTTDHGLPHKPKPLSHERARSFHDVVSAQQDENLQGSVIGNRPPVFGAPPQAGSGGAGAAFPSRPVFAPFMDENAKTPFKVFSRPPAPGTTTSRAAGENQPQVGGPSNVPMFMDKPSVFTPKTPGMFAVFHDKTASTTGGTGGGPAPAITPFRDVPVFGARPGTGTAPAPAPAITPFRDVPVFGATGDDGAAVRKPFMDRPFTFNPRGAGGNENAPPPAFPAKTPSRVPEMVFQPPPGSRPLAPLAPSGLRQVVQPQEEEQEEEQEEVEVSEGDQTQDHSVDMPGPDETQDQEQDQDQDQDEEANIEDQEVEQYEQYDDEYSHTEEYEEPLAPEHIPRDPHHPHTDLEEGEESFNQDVPLGGRFGQFNVMTPITERTLEFTGHGGIGMTPSERYGGGHTGRSDIQAREAAKQLAEELIDEEDEVGEEEYRRGSNVIEPLQYSTADLDMQQQRDSDDRTGSLSLLDTLTLGSKFRPSNPCNPFDPSILSNLLSRIAVDPHFYDLKTEEAGHLEGLDKFAKKSRKAGSTAGGGGYPLTLHGQRFVVSEKLGEGGFGMVFKARDLGEKLGEEDEDEDDFDEDDEDEECASMVALKVVKPRNIWEYHVLRRLHSALPTHLRRSVVLPHALFAFADESYLVMDLCPQGMLLNIVNNAVTAGVAQAGACLDELLVMFFTIELLRLIESMHAIGIIHGDLKIDNCLLRLEEVPGGAAAWNAIYDRNGEGGWSYKGLKVIDFGRTIDTRLFPQGQKFVADWETDERDCFEVREGKSWTYETDYFGLAGIVYCMLYGKYIQTSAVGISVDLERRVEKRKIVTPMKRYWQTGLWTRLFDVLLNPGLATEDGTLPVCDALAEVRQDMETWLEGNCNRTSNTLKGLLKKVELACY